MYFIAIDGLSGSGKTAALNEGVREWLVNFCKPRTVVFFDEPFGNTGDLFIETVRTQILYGNTVDAHTRYHSLLAVRARVFQHWVTTKAREHGDHNLVLVSDGSMLRHMVGFAKLYPMLATFNLAKIAQSCLPNLFLFMDAPVEVICRRKGLALEKNRLEALTEDRNNFLEAAKILFTESQQKCRMIQETGTHRNPDGSLVELPLKTVAQNVAGHLQTNIVF